MHRARGIIERGPAMLDTSRGHWITPDLSKGRPSMTSENPMCCIPKCERRAASQIAYPLCGHHARKVYLEVRDLMADPPARIAVQAARESSKGDPLRSQRGVVYVARCRGLVKIGYSTNVRQRMRQIGGTLIHCEPGTMLDEKALHARFGPQWERGEYFREEGPLAEYVASLGG